MKISYQYTGNFWLKCIRRRIRKTLTHRTIGVICVSLFLYQTYLFFKQYLENPTARRVAFKESFIMTMTIISISVKLNNLLIFIRTSEKLTSLASHSALLTADIKMRVSRDLTTLELKISSVGKL